MFDVNSGLKQTFRNLHSKVVNDVSYSNFYPDLFSSCSDDLSIKIVDVRNSSNSSVTKNAHKSTIESISFSPHKAELLATSSSDKTIKIWDYRSMNTPRVVLKGHAGSVMSVRWSPHYESILASGSADRRVNIWDLNKIDKKAGEESEELLFVHGGHTAQVADFDWNPCEPMEICSSAEDGLLHVWKIPIEGYI